MVVKGGRPYLSFMSKHAHASFSSDISSTTMVRGVWFWRASIITLFAIQGASANERRGVVYARTTALQEPCATRRAITATFLFALWCDVHISLTFNEPCKLFPRRNLHIRFYARALST